MTSQPPYVLPPFDAADAFLRAKREACAARSGESLDVHGHCDCGRAPTWCTHCDRDVETSSDLTFVDGDFLCAFCVEDKEDREAAE